MAKTAISKELQTEIQSLKDLHKPRNVDRMDADLNRYLLEEFTWKNKKNEEIDGADNITLTDPQTFADKVAATLGSGEMHLDVDCFDNTEGSDYGQAAEEFIRYLFEEVDTNLAVAGEYPYEDAQNFYAPVRGIIVSRPILYFQAGLYMPEITVIDARQFVWRSDKRGVATGVTTSEFTKEEIEILFGEKISQSKGIIDDVWTHTDNIIVLNNKDVLINKPHGLPSNPLVVTGCPTTPPLAGIKDSIKYQNESIYAPVRTMYDALNKQGTMWQSSNAMSIFPPMQFISPHGRKSKSPPYGIRAIMNLKTGEHYDAMPIRDVSLSHQAWFGQIMSRIQRSTMSNIDYGEVTDLSAVAIKRLESKNDQVIMPRLKAKREHRRVQGRKFIEQFTSDRGGYLGEIPEGLGRPITKWKPADFKEKKFTIFVNYVSTNAEKTIADSTIAQNLQAMGIDNEYIFGNVLGFEDVKGRINKKRMQDAEKSNPEVAVYRQILAFLEDKDGNTIHNQNMANILAQSIGLTLEQVINPQSPVGVQPTAEVPPAEPMGSLPNLMAQPNSPGVTMPQQPEMETLNATLRQNRREK